MEFVIKAWDMGRLIAVRRSAQIAIACVLLLSSGPVFADAPASPRELAEAYVQAISRDDWQTARSLWSPADLAAARRLGISYRGQPFKLDSASLLVLERARVQTGTIRTSVGEIETDGDVSRIHYKLRAGNDVAEARSFAVRLDEGWHLAAPVTALAADWPRRRTEFLDVRMQPPLQMSEDVIFALDGFVAGICQRLALSPSRVELLRSEKLGYLLCDGAMVADIVGAPTYGAALLQTDDVVTSEPCHLHELAHLLVNYALQDLPLYTLPVLQEGAAVALGGRWGRSPEVMSGLGRYVLAEDLLEIEDLLTWDGFYGNSADLTYAPSGVFTAFLLDLLGGQRFLALYRSLSGDLSDLRQLDSVAIRGRICEAAGMSWQQLLEDLDLHVDCLSCGGVVADDMSGSDHVATLNDEILSVTVTGDGQWLCWRAEAEGRAAGGSVLFRDSRPGDDSERVPLATNRLFGEQFPGRPYRGEIMAVIFSPEEVGLYDFRTGLLVAKFVASFCPRQALSRDGGARLEFRIRRELFPDGVWDLELIPDGR